ncbi:MAG: class I SAM-dependent methyltransferase [Pyrinomonadaceae bacterium MAG19_C2-C3]|nr:class I SAM-dependent methyltransferase [Pyrinomonadaceae bacterium MAG19_C2-C3]
MKEKQKKLPENFDSFTVNLLKEAETVEGYLSPNEMRFLALLAACPTADGDVLEIGSFKGRSTIILSKAAALADADAKIHAVDPMTAPSETDPDLRGAETSLTDFQKNIKAHGVADRIEFHQTFSYKLAETWTRPIRFLWIDGDHTYKGTKLDFDGFAPHLSDGAIVAIHDVLHEFDGGIRVYMEDILLSPNFGAGGFCGSIGWAQFHGDERAGWQFREEKLELYRRLSRLVPHVVFKKELKGLEKKIYKLKRSRVPRGAVNPADWLRTVK